MIRKTNKFLTRLKCEGGNLIGFINNLSSNNIFITDLLKIDEHTIEFTINYKDLKKIKSLGFYNVKLTILNQGGIKTIVNILCCAKTEKRDNQVFRNSHT